MKEITNVVAIYDGNADDEALSRLTLTEEMERRRTERRREHRREKRLCRTMDVILISAMCMACFIIGLCVGGW